MGNTVNKFLGMDDKTESTEDAPVDFVLAYENETKNSIDNEKRQIFQANLLKEGLKLQVDSSPGIDFVKINAPVDVLCRYAEFLNIKLPLERIPGQELIYENDLQLFDRCKQCWPSHYDAKNAAHHDPLIFQQFSRRHAELFRLSDPDFFNSGIRNSIVNFILERQHFVKGYESPDNLGIEKLIYDGVYLAAFPIHNDNERTELLRDWAALRNCLRPQPLPAIYRYFGAKVALYFAWLGFYRGMLLSLSICGICSFLYGLLTLASDPLSQAICDKRQKMVMCPLCDRNCDYWELSSTCFSAKLNYVLDNWTTVAFAIFTSVWTVVYLEFWKRYAAGLVHSWGLLEYSAEVEHPRPQYLARLAKQRKYSLKLNAANSSLEPVVPFWRFKFLPYLLSYSIVVVFICASLVALSALVVYRMAEVTADRVFGDTVAPPYRTPLMSVMAGVVDLAVISLLNQSYKRLAIWLNNMEYHRTRTEYEESLTIKNYIFEFVNFYTSLFYIAFLKNKFVGYPAKYNRIWGLRQEECRPGGCLLELCLQLLIIMAGKQLINAIVEMLLPYIHIVMRLLHLSKTKIEAKINDRNPWTRDFNLMQFTSVSLFGEYLEMVIQFGFVVLFGVAFALVPLLALINNIFEVRLDAIKFLKLMQRPIARRARDIGVWYSIMEVLTRFAVLTNAFIIAFSTNFIPKIVYFYVTGDRSFKGFLNFTLANFDIKDFEVKPKASQNPDYNNVTNCWYSAYRNSADHSEPYGRPLHYWYIIIGRLAFIALFQNVIGVVQALISWALPDVPDKLMRRIKREDYLKREHIIDYERNLAIAANKD